MMFIRVKLTDTSGEIPKVESNSLVATPCPKTFAALRKWREESDGHQ